MDFNRDFYWHDAVIKSIVVDRNNPRVVDEICNRNMIDKYGAWLNKLENNGSLIYSLELSSCVTHTSMAIGIHPYILNAQMYLRNLGIRPGLFLNYYHLNY